jgi:exodeoxyribonuclease VII small subunit
MAQFNSADKAKNRAAETPMPATQDIKFEAALAELEQIVHTMEDGRLPLEESIDAYRRGSELLKHCQQQLSDADRKIQVLEDGALRDFDANHGEAK